MFKCTILLFFTAIICACARNVPAKKNVIPNIGGYWRNQLGSTMVIRQKGRLLVGKYCTAVSRYPLKRPSFSLVGNVGTGTPTSLGWVVTYTSKDKSSISTAAWSGQYRLKKGKPIILTTWTSTTIGKDHFFRVKNDPTCKLV